jgi:hypothetical protein
MSANRLGAHWRGDAWATELEAYGQRRITTLVQSWLAGLLPEPLEDIEQPERAERAQLRALLDGGDS